MADGCFPSRMRCSVDPSKAKMKNCCACLLLKRRLCYWCGRRLSRKRLPMAALIEMARNVLEAFGGEYIVYIGEWRDSVGIVAQLSNRTHDYGQTAGALFQAAVEASFELVERIHMPRWPGFADDLRVYRRQRTPAHAPRAGLPHSFNITMMITFSASGRMRVEMPGTSVKSLDNEFSGAACRATLCSTCCWTTAQPSWSCVGCSASSASCERRNNMTIGWCTVAIDKDYSCTYHVWESVSDR